MLKLFAFVFVFSCLAAPTYAQDEKKQDPPKEEQKKDPDVEKYEKAIAEATKYEGEFTLYVRKADVLLELPADKFDRLFLTQVTLHSGFSPMGGQAGEPLSAGPLEVFKWVKKDDKVLLVQPHTRFRWDEGDPLATASERTFPEGIVATFKVENTHPEKKLVLINATSFFQGGLFNLPQIVGAGTGGAASLDRELTDVDQIRNVDGTTIVRMNTHFRSQGGGEMAELMALLGLSAPNHLEHNKSIPFKVTYSLWYRQDDGYVPRVADPRIGYFTQDFFSVSKFGETDRTQRFIGRFDLRKKDPFAGLSEPVEPIVWYVDSSVPQKYRAGVRAGILAWNKAFEKIGYKDAIVVKDAPENDPNWDHADSRHNLVRWIMSESAAYAVAWFRMDPLSGKVLNAAVSVDANYPAAMLREFDFTLRKGAIGNEEIAQKALLRSAAGEPDWHNMLVNDLDPKVEAFKSAMDLHGWNRGRCEYAGELAHSAAMGWAVLMANGSNVTEDDYMNSFMADLVMHEVGHCLGLRHNFAGSTQLSVADLLNDEKVRSLGLSASVMDYTPVNTPAVLRGDGVFFNDAVGPYDMWAIEYGYSALGAKNPADEKAQLDMIARRTGEPGHIFLTDDDADGINPLAVRFDLGSNTVEWMKSALAGNAAVRAYAANGLTKPGENYSDRNRLILSSFTRDARTTMMATRFIGGVEMRRMHKGDVNERPTLAPVSPQIQRQAMKLVIERSLLLDGVSLPPGVIKGLSMDPNGTNGGFWNAPLRSIIGSNQRAVLSSLMSASKADAILENDFKMQGEKDRYTIAEHYNWLFAAVFKEVGTNANITAMRRDLQRFMIEGLVTQATARQGMLNDDVRVVASQGLNRLKLRFDQQIAKPKGLDELTLLHLKDVSDRIGRFQKRIAVNDR